MTTATKQSRRIGLSDLYYAIVASDDANATTYDTPVRMMDAVSAAVQPKTNMEVFYGDDGANDTATAIGEITVDFEVGLIPTEVSAALLGSSIGTDGTLLQKSTDVAPYVALGFRSIKANGKYRYKWLYKGKFQWLNETYKTMDGKPEGETEKLSGTFVRRQSDDSMQITADEDDPAFTGGANWFSQVQEQNPDITPLTVTVNPANGATAVPDNSSVTWTFSKAIQPQYVTSSNFFVLQGSNQVAGALSLSTDQLTVTFTPTAAFTAATSFTAIATTSVKDLGGQTMAQNSVSSFTTA